MLLAGILTAFAVLLGLPLLILWTRLTGDPGFMYRTSMRYCRFIVRLLGVRVRVEGLENLPPGAFVLAANHASNLDPPILLSSLPRRASIFAKRELFRVPIFATGMRAARFIPVDRGGMKATAGLATAVALLKGGLPLAIFPEGTRSPDGRLRPFKKGAFAIAIEAGVPIVPVAIAGTHRLLRRGDSTIRPGEVTLRLGPAVDASAFTVAQRPELLARIEALVAAALPPDQQPAPGSGAP